MTAVNDPKKKAPSTSILEKLSSLFPNANYIDIWIKTKSIINSPQRDLYQEKLSKFVTDAKDNPFLKKNIKEMYQEGYSFEQIFLYLDAPDQSPLRTQTTKQEYLKIWNSENNFKRKHKPIEIFDRGKFAAGSITALVGLPVVFGTLATGFLINNVDIVEVSNIMSNEFGGLTDNLRQAIQQPSLKSLGQAALAGLGVGYGVTKFKSSVQEAKECYLYKNISETDPTQREIFINHIDQLSVSSQHLLTHLTPEELQLFLIADEQTQEDILVTRPPSFDQRTKSLLSSDSAMASKLRENLKLACAKWENEVEMFDHPVTLKASLLKIRRERQTSIEVPAHKMGNSHTSIPKNQNN